MRSRAFSPALPKQVRNIKGGKAIVSSSCAAPPPAVQLAKEARLSHQLAPDDGLNHHLLGLR